MRLVGFISSVVVLGVGCSGGSGAGGAGGGGGGTTPIRADEHVVIEGATVAGDTRNARDGYQPSCGESVGGADDRWSFTPSESGFYRVHVDAEYDAVVAVRVASSDEVGCNDDAENKRTAELSVELVAGRTYDVVVDGYQGATGAYHLTVSRGDPPVPEGRRGRLLVDQEVSDTIVGETSHANPTCGAREGSPDQIWHFVPESSGLFRFRVSADYDSTISVIDERGAELGCNDDFEGSRGESEVALTLAAGQSYGIVVDGYQGEAGAYRLRATQAGGGTGATPPQAGGGPLAIGTRQTGDTTNATDTLTPQCGSQAGSGDHVWVVTPQQSGTYRGRVDAHYDSVLAVYDDRGAEIVCNDDAASAQQSEVEIYLEAGRQYRFVVDGFNTARGSYEILVDLVRNTPPVTPQTLQRAGTLTLNRATQGATTGGTDQLTPSCGSQAGSPDQVYELTVPRNGNYQVHVMSQYDAVVALYDAQLTEVECNDDLRSTNEAGFTTRLQRGQTYYVAVDGYGGANGQFVVRAFRERKPGRGPAIP